MPLRGEMVGDIYVRSHVDGSGMEKDIEDELDRVDGGKQGRKIGEKYGDEFSRAAGRKFDKEQKRQFEVSVKNAAKTANQTHRIYQQKFFKKIEDDIKRTFGGGEIGERLANDLRIALRDSNKGIEFFVRANTKGAESDFERFMRTLSARSIKYEVEIDDRNKKIVKSTEEAAKRSAKAIQEGFGPSSLRSVRNLGFQFERTGDQMDKGFIRRADNLVPRVKRTENTLTNLGRNLDRLAPNIGRAFGKGARNDAVNFFGSMVQGMTGLVTGSIRAAGSIQSFGGTLISTFRSAGSFKEGLAAVGKQFSGLAKGGSGLASSVAGLAVAIPILVVVLGTVTSAVSALLGVVTALASSLSFALVGALGAVAGALVPVAAGVGVLAAAILSMSDAQKKALKEAIRPFVSEVKEIGKAAADALFGGKQFKTTIETMTSAVKKSRMKELVVGIAEAIGTVGSGWSKALDSPGFRRFIKVMEDNLPKQIRSLGRTTSNVFSGIGGTIIALQPITNQFLGWLEDLTEKWAKFAQSDKGQAKMIAFFEDAAESIKSVGNFLRETGGLLKDLLFNAEGKKAGDSLFDSMAKSIKQFRDYIADGGLEQWFKDAKNFGEDLGIAIRGIGKALDALDSPGFRAFAGFLISRLEDMGEAAETIVSPFSDLADAIDSLGDKDFGDAFEGFIRSANDFVGIGPQLIANMLGGDISYGEIGGKIVTGIKDGIVNAAQSIGPAGISLAASLLTPLSTAIISGLTNVGSLAVGNAQAVGSTLMQAVGAGFSASVGAIQSAAGSISGAISSSFTAARGQASSLASSLRGTLSSAAGSVGSRFSTLAGTARSTLGSALDSARGKAGSLASSLSGRALSAVNSLRSGASSLGGVLSGALSSGLRLAGSVAGTLRSALSGISSMLRGIASAARSAASALSNIKVPSLGGLADKFFATGGIVYGPTRAVIGEAGPEAVIPLNRPLSQVDPAVRALSAIAQGKGDYTSTTSNERSVTIGEVKVITPSRDPRTVARETVDEIAASLL